MEEEQKIPSPNEVEAALVSDNQMLDGLPSFSTELERDVALKLIPIISAKAEARAEARKAKELEKLQEAFKLEAKAAIEKAVADVTKANQPPDPKDLEKLLNQEYVEFTVVIPVKGNKRSFTIRELPQSVEMNMLKAIKTKLVPHLEAIAKIEWTEQAGSSSISTRIQNVINVVPDVMDVVAEICAVALNPLKEEPDITADWVRSNLSSGRILHIVEAQIVAGKFRDFFLSASRLITF